jgi:hypothetical protein
MDVLLMLFESFGSIRAVSQVELRMKMTKEYVN